MDRDRKRIAGIAALILALFLVALPFAAGALTESVEDQETTLHLSWGSFEGLYTGDVEDGIPQGKGTFLVTAVLDQVTGQVLYTLPDDEVEEVEEEIAEASDGEPAEAPAEGPTDELVEEPTEEPDDHSSLFWTYKGAFDAGLPTGKGTLTYEDGTRVSGYFYQGDFLGDSLDSAEESAGAVVLEDDESEDAGFQSQFQSAVSLVLLTDWQGTVQQQDKLLELVGTLVSQSRTVVVAFNGDNESLADLAGWRINHTPTSFMRLVDTLTAYPQVQVVAGLGERELSLNPVGAQDSSILAAYLTDLSSHGAGRLHVVNTDLDFAQGSAMDDLFDYGIVQRTAQVAGISFLSLVDPVLMGREYTEPADNAQGGQILGKNALYSPEALLDPAGSMTTAIAARTMNLGDTPCVLLAHCAGTGQEAIGSYYEGLALTERTIVVSGHDLGPMSYSLVGTGPLFRLQPPALGAGCDVLYLNESGDNWLTTKRNRVVIDMYSDWNKVGAPVDHVHAFRDVY